MEVLLLLIERAGHLVTREEIAERVWGKDVFLDTDNSINSAIRKIRLVLRDDSDQPRFVQTVVGRGYLFLSSQLEQRSEADTPPLTSERLEDGALAGRRIGDYRILELLGGGGMGVVYKAEDLKLGRQVAIKFLPRELAGDPSAVERMQREARLASSLDHPHICSIYQLAQDEGQLFMVMPLLEGRTLREWITAEADRPATTCVREVLKLAIQISDALQFAHNKGIVHRDIKPANIFLTTRGEIKILDFGVATIRGGASGGPTLVTETATTAADTTRAGLSPGTPAYLSPEQVKGEKLDARSDLFSFGSVLYEMATGQRPFPGASAVAIEAAIVNMEPQPIRQLKSGLPERFEQIVARTLEKDRERRYQSTADLHADLCTLHAKLAPQTGIPANHRPPSKQLYALVAVLVLAVLGIVALLRKSPSPQPFKDFAITQITNTGRAEQVAISPDGKYAAYVSDVNGQKSMRLRNISTASDTEILAPVATRFRSLAFSPDGNYLYFRQLVNSIGSEWDAFRVPVLGGKPELVARDVDGDIIFSPDGLHISYVRANDPEDGKYRVLKANLDGSAETILTIQQIKGFGHEGYPPFATWSPDGKKIAYTFAKMADEPGIVRLLDLDSKHLDVLQHFPDLLTFEIHWLPDSNWLLLVHSPKGGEVTHRRSARSRCAIASSTPSPGTPIAIPV
jgi:eukaryotic-like serine/threonine-protein kinase